MNYLEKMVLNTVKLGPLPKHVAFIMDGNRRFAKKSGKNAWEGHTEGYSSLLRVLQWCLVLDVKVVTIYAFSIDNFKRPKAEVETLMKLAEEKFQEFLKHQALVMQHEIRVRILGDLDLLPEGVKRAAANVMHATAHHKRLTLNICFSYTSGEEISSTVRNVVQAARDGLIEKEDIDESFLSQCLYTRGSSPDLLVRTSGETRFSDFLVWQCSRAHLCFLDVTWPEIDLWTFLTCIWDFQAHRITEPEQSPALQDIPTDKLSTKKRERQEKYLEYLESKELEHCKQWM